MKKVLLSILTVACMSSAVTAQQGQPTGNQTRMHRTCGSGVLPDEYEQWLQPLIQKQMEERANAKGSGVQTVYTIPIVFHVIHNGSNVGVSYNISDAQVLSQLAVLNEDYRRLNADTTNTPSVFAGAAADCEIQFCMAQRDPSGNTTTGIDRINRNTLGFSAPPYTQTYIDATIKSATIWNTNNYLNIWVVPDYTTSGFQLLGHATFPAGSGLSGLTGNFGNANTDGVVVWYRACGRVGQLDPSYNKGRTLTHEVGHWLGLRHIWGDGTCATDYCTDTPTQQTSNFFCPTFPSTSSCTGNAPNGDQFMNYMDYCDDDCLNMFTENQKTRMVTVLTNAPMRVSQRNSIACTPVGLNENTATLNVNLYPNPANDVIRVSIGKQQGSSDVTFRILNMLGAEVTSTIKSFNPDGEYELDLTSISQGFYFVEINNDYGKKLVKFQISR